MHYNSSDDGEEEVDTNVYPCPNEDGQGMSMSSSLEEWIYQLRERPPSPRTFRMLLTAPPPTQRQTLQQQIRALIRTGSFEDAREVSRQLQALGDAEEAERQRRLAPITQLSP